MRFGRRRTTFLVRQNASYLENNCADQNVSLFGKVDRPIRDATAVNGDQVFTTTRLKVRAAGHAHRGNAALAEDSATPLNTRSTPWVTALFLRRSGRRYSNTGRRASSVYILHVSENLSAYGSHLMIGASHSLDRGKANFLFARDPREAQCVPRFLHPDFGLFSTGIPRSGCGRASRNRRGDGGWNHLMASCRSKTLRHHSYGLLGTARAKAAGQFI